MKKRMLAILAIISMTFALGAGSALAKSDSAAKEKPADRCEASDGKAEGCENHPGDHTEDDENEEGDANPLAPLCDALAQLDQQLTDACYEVTNAIFGGDPEPTDPEPTDPEPTDPEPTDPEPSDPSCDDLSAIDNALVGACKTITGEGEPSEPSDPNEPAENPLAPLCQGVYDIEVQLGAACFEITNAIFGSDTEPTDPEPTDPEPTDPEPTDPEPSDPSCADLDQLDPALAAGCQEVVDGLTDAGLPV